MGHENLELMEREPVSEQLKEIIGENDLDGLYDLWWTTFTTTKQSKSHGTYNIIDVNEIDGAYMTLMWWLTLLGLDLRDVFGYTNQEGSYSAGGFSGKVFNKCIPFLLDEKQKKAWRANLSFRLGTHMWARIRYENEKKRRKLCKNIDETSIIPEAELKEIAETINTAEQNLQESIDKFAEFRVARKYKIKDSTSKNEPETETKDISEWIEEENFGNKDLADAVLNDPENEVKQEMLDFLKNI